MRGSKASPFRRLLFFVTLVSAACALAAPIALAGDFADFGTTDNEVTVGSRDSFFSQNKQNEPGLAVDANNPSVVAAGANDNIDLELCNAGADTTCPFTDGVGVSGISFSLDGGTSWIQPQYTGWTARDCTGVNDPPPPAADIPDNCAPHVGPIGTLPKYYENGLVSGGDPALAFGPRPGAGGFSWANGSRLYYANLTSNFSAARAEQTFRGAEAIAVSRTDDVPAAAAGSKDAWFDPVIVSRQSSALFSDKEAVWADNASSSRFFGNVYVCNVAFRGNGAGGAEPVLFARSTDGGSSWTQRQITQAANTGSGAGRSGGRQGCTIRTDSTGVVYVFFSSSLNRQSGQFLARSFDGGVTFERSQPVASVEECGLPDPATGRLSFDGVAGARTDSFPSVDIANGAPTGEDATNEIVLTWCDGPTPSTTSPGPNEQALVQWSVDQGTNWSTPVNAAPASSDRPDFPAIAISPDGTDVYVTYDNFLQPWQPSTLAPARLMQGVVRHADVTSTSTGALGSFADVHRAPTGDARGSSQNNLAAEFLGDYNYAVATRDSGIAVWNDVRQAADCPAIDQFRFDFVAFLQSSGAQPVDEDGGELIEPSKPKGTAPTPPARPEPNNDCPQAPDSAFGNTDIWGGAYADPTP